MRLMQVVILCFVYYVVCIVNGIDGYGGECTNRINDEFFNKCRRELPPGMLSAIGETVNTWINPVGVAVSGSVLLLALPYILLHTHVASSRMVMPLEVVVSYQRVFLIVVNFLHRVGYSLALTVALYTIFKQNRPCKCNDMVYSEYGMPSGDAMAGGIVAVTIVWYQPFSKYVSWLAAVCVICLKCIERVSLGYHSLGQVTAGTTFGIVLSLYQLFAPQAMMFFDMFVVVVLGSIFIPLDPNLKFDRFDNNNLFSWYLWGVGLYAWLAVLLYRFYSRRQWVGFYRRLDESLLLITTRTVSTKQDYIDDGGSDYPTDPFVPSVLLASTRSSDDQPLTEEMSVVLTNAADLKWTWISWLCMFIGVGLVSYMCEVYGWGD